MIPIKKIVLKILKGICCVSIIICILYLITGISEEEGNKKVYDEMQNIHESEENNKEENLENNTESTFSHWLEIPETNINYPVAQGKDNSFYLNHDYYGNYHSYGCLFLNYKTNENTTNYVIYGHNVNLAYNRPMFAMLVDYKKQEFRDNHKYIYFDNEKYQLVAVIKYNVKNLSKWNYMQREFTEEEFQEYKNEMKHYAMYFDDSITLKNEPKNILTLSTCDRLLNYGPYGKNGRLLIIAQKI